MRRNIKISLNTTPSIKASACFLYHSSAFYHFPAGIISRRYFFLLRDDLEAHYAFFRPLGWLIVSRKQRRVENTTRNCQKGAKSQAEHTHVCWVRDLHQRNWDEKYCGRMRLFCHSSPTIEYTHTRHQTRALSPVLQGASAAFECAAWKRQPKVYKMCIAAHRLTRVSTRTERDVPSLFNKARFWILSYKCAAPGLRREYLMHTLRTSAQARIASTCCVEERQIRSAARDETKISRGFPSWWTHDGDYR